MFRRDDFNINYFVTINYVIISNSNIKSDFSINYFVNIIAHSVIISNFVITFQRCPGELRELDQSPESTEVREATQAIRLTPSVRE